MLTDNQKIDTIKDLLCFSHTCTDTVCQQSKRHVFKPRFSKKCRVGEKCTKPRCWYTHPDNWKPPVDLLVMEMCGFKKCPNPWCNKIHPDLDTEEFQAHDGKRLKPCRYGSRCRNGKDCPFDHSKEKQEQKVLCKFDWKSCRFGHDCIYFHSDKPEPNNDAKSQLMTLPGPPPANPQSAPAGVWVYLPYMEKPSPEQAQTEQ